MVTLSELETVFKISELLQGLWTDSKNSRRKCKSLVNTKNDLKILKDKFCALTKKHEAAEMILNEQRIQLDHKEKELKNTFSSFNLQLEYKINEIKDINSEVFNLRRQIEDNERGISDQENQVRGREPIER